VLRKVEPKLPAPGSSSSGSTTAKKEGTPTPATKPADEKPAGEKPMDEADKKPALPLNPPASNPTSKTSGLDRRA